MINNTILRISPKDKLEAQNSSHPLSGIAEKLGAISFKDGGDFYFILPTYKGFTVGDYGYKHGLGKAILCFGEFRWENFELDDYKESKEEDKTSFCGFYWLRSIGGDLDNLPSPQYDNFTIEGNIFKDYADTGEINKDLEIFTM